MPPSAASSRPGLSLKAPVKRSAHVSEQLALEQMLTESGACDLDEGSVFARAEAVDIGRQHALSGAALAGQQHRGVAARNLGRKLRELPALGSQCEQWQRLRKPLQPGPQRAILGAQTLQFERARDHAANLLGGERLGNVVVGAVAHRFDRIGNRRERCHHDDRQPGIEPLQFRQQAEAVHPGHSHVAQYQVRGRFGKQLERLLGAVRFGHLITGGVEGRGNHAPDIAIVIDDQDVSQSLPPAPEYPP